MPLKLIVCYPADAQNPYNDRSINSKIIKADTAIMTCFRFITDLKIGYEFKILLL